MRNVCFIVIDALRARNLPEWGYPMMTAPNITKICDESWVYRRAYSHCNFTTPSVCTMLTGKHAYEHGVAELTLTDESYLKVPTIIDKYNSSHKTIMINDLFIDLMDKEGKIWKRFDSAPRYGVEKYIGDGLDKLGLPPYTEAERTTNAAIAEIPDEPFLMYVHYWDVHWPWLDGKEYIDDFMMETSFGYDTEEWREQLTGIGKMVTAAYYPEFVDNLLYWCAWYDAEIYYMDMHLQRLIDKLPEDTLIIIVADHGEAFGEHGAYFTHSQGGLYEEILHVPLIVRYPDGERRLLNENVGTEHVYDIIDDWLSYSDRKEYKDEFIYSMCRKEAAGQWDSVIYGKYKMICRNGNLEKLALFNVFLAPEEQKINPFPPSKLELLKRKLREYMLRWYMT